MASDPVGCHNAWDAGDLACGPMLLALKSRLERLAPGQVFRLVTRDEGAPVDLPAWCRLTGHTLIDVSHPVYHLARRED
jgi:tRNA 2-thiouridine synthesizing protein A